MNTKLKRNLLRMGLCVLLVVFGVFLAVIGMYHTIILDNNEVSRNGLTLSPVEGAHVISKDISTDIDAEDRGAIAVKGPKNTLILEVPDEGGNGTKRVVFPLRLKFEKMVVLSVPLLVNGDNDPFLKE